ncbi:hypothetical protein C0993_009031 [Termitomyces sp. T159_Od127]|nr:hypothetical protein C0993_009031 [Termitomyces sp. T159_Od127]
MLPYPPGPAPSPISGNFWGLPTKFPWLKYAEWAKQYGNLIHLKAFTNHIVVVNNVDDATALFEKRSRIYSNRPRSTMVELMGFDFSVAFIGYGDKWRRHRRIYHQTLNKAAVQRTQEPTQTLKVHDYLNQLVVAPDDFMAHFRKQVSFLHMAQSEIEKFTYISEVALTKLSGAFLPGTFIVDALSFLKYIPAWFPGANFKRYAAECRVLTDEMQRGPMKYVKERLAAGFEVSGLVATLLERKGDQDAYQKELDTREIAATIFAGISDE